MFRFLIIILLTLSVSVFAQDYTTKSKKAIKNYEKAKEYFLHKQDKLAEELLLKSVDKDDKFVEAWFMLAQISHDRGESMQAVEYYLNGLNADPGGYPSGYLKVAGLEYSVGRYLDAQTHLEMWKDFELDDERSLARAKALERNLTFSVKAVQDPVPFDPISLGEAVNTEYYEYWPSLSVDERKIFFTVLMPPNPELPPQRLNMQEDFYFAEKQDDQWVNRTYLGPPVNTNGNEGAQTITADGKIIIFTACNTPDGHGRMCDLYFSMVREDGSWSPPVNLGDVVNTVASEKHPSISPDGRTLYFTSNRGGGKGNYDIWKTTWEENGWTKPVNLGDSINTPGIEQSPFIHPDQKTLYFSSDGWPGLGKGDIFITRMKENGEWQKASNLGYPINTHNEEIGFIVNARGTKAYYATNRREGTDTDIVAFDIPEEVRPDPVSYISGRVYDSRTMKGIAARFQLIDLTNGEVVMESASNEGEGDYFLSLPSGRAYAFNVSQPGYLFYSDHFEIEKNYSVLDPYRKDIPLDPIRSGSKIVLRNVFFDTDSYVLKDESKTELEKIFEFLQQNSAVRVEISGHTDNTGTSEYNLELSQRRAGAVVEYLTGKGISQDRLISKGYGDTQPVGDNSTEDGRAENRRTELKIL